ncbi:MAG: hypothetical protein WCW03_00580 [Candidatus Paceibacterota bacterium]|jgi:hypothetical protein
MPRRVEDIIPNDRRSIRDISSGFSKEATGNKTSIEKKINGEHPIRLRKIPIAPPLLNEKRPKAKKDSRKIKIALFVAGSSILLLTLAYFASIYFARAIFTVVPREIPVIVNSTYVVSNTAQNNLLTYNLLSASTTINTTVSAKDGASIEKKAQGTVTLYNVYSPKPWRLIAGTRLTNTSGKIYRLTGSVLIPGYTKAISGPIVPGKINVPIIADQPGSEYNLTLEDGMNDFIIVAYKGGDKYTSIYARLAKDIQGGFAGKRKIVGDTDLATVTSTIKTQLTTKLLEEIKSKISEKDIMYDKAFIISFGSPEIGGDKPGIADVSIHANIYGITFDKEELIKKLSGEISTSSFGDNKFDTIGLQELAFSISNLNDFSPQKKNSLIIKLQGDIKLIGNIPVDELKQKFAGIPLSETQNILRSYSSLIVLDKSSGQVVPPWAKVPKDTDKISILTK